MCDAIKKAFKKYPGLMNIVFINVKNKDYPNTIILVSNIVKFWIHIDDDNPNEKVVENIKLFRELGYTTGFVNKGKIKKRNEDDCKEYDFEFALKGSIEKWLGNLDPATKPSEAGFKQQITELIL